MNNNELSDSSLSKVSGGVNYFVGKKIKITVKINGNLTGLGPGTITKATYPEQATLNLTGELYTRIPGIVMFDEDDNPDD